MTSKIGALEVLPARADAGADGFGTPRRLPKRLRLSTLADIEVEMRRLYTAARQGEVDTRDASRLAFMLRTLAEIIGERTIEQRLDQIEQHLTQEQEQ
jgi:hypothetical protein